MANTQPSPQRGETFLKYRYLPKEIRLMVIEEAVEEAIRAAPPQSPGEDASWTVQAVEKPKPLAQLSAVDPEWNGVIEMRLFNSITITASDLVKFAKYCSKRHGRLDTIRLAIQDEEIDFDVRPEYFVGKAILKLFETMYRWDPRNREGQSLIQVQIDLRDVVTVNDSGDFNIPFGFAILPQVPSIEALYEVPKPEGDPLLPEWYSLALYRALPNVRRASLNLKRLNWVHLGFARNIYFSLAHARNHIFSLGQFHPSLTRLELLPDLQMSTINDRWEAWATGPNCLAAFPPSWYNSLVRLDLKQIKEVPEFLVEAGQVAWPNLETLVLLGEIESDGLSDKQLRTLNKVTCTALLRGLIALIPSTPKLTTVLIEMVDFAWDWDAGSFRIQMCLGQLAEGVEASFEPSCSFAPCSYSFVPTQDVGTMVVSGTKVSGEIATELQRTLRIHQRKDIAVFYHSFKPTTWGRGRCRQWNAEEGSWDIVFENEGDEIIYQMGRYLDLTEA